MKLEDIKTENQPEYQTLSPSASEADCDGDELEQGRDRLSEYKLKHLENIKRNKEFLLSLGLEGQKQKKKGIVCQ